MGKKPTYDTNVIEVLVFRLSLLLLRIETVQGNQHFLTKPIEQYKLFACVQ